MQSTKLRSGKIGTMTQMGDDWSTLDEEIMRKFGIREERKTCGDCGKEFVVETRKGRQPSTDSILDAVHSWFTELVEKADYIDEAHKPSRELLERAKESVRKKIPTMTLCDSCVSSSYPQEVLLASLEDSETNRKGKLGVDYLVLIVELAHYSGHIAGAAWMQRHKNSITKEVMDEYASGKMSLDVYISRLIWCLKNDSTSPRTRELSEEEKILIRELYPGTSMHDLARILGRSSSTIHEAIRANERTA